MNDASASIAILIDGDNLSPDAVDEAICHLQCLGAVTIRRAYGGLEKLSGLREVLRRHSIQGFVNQGKGTTDVALVVDAMDLLHRHALPATVAIASSDADFSPLAVRFREAGLRVICVAQKDKAAEALLLGYHEVVFVASAALVTSLHATSKPANVFAEKNTTALSELKVGSLPGTSVISLEKNIAVEDVAAVKRILNQLPNWLPNTIRQLNQLGAPLRESGIKKGNSPLHELFKKYPSYFKVLPMTGAPKQVRLLKLP